MFTISKTFSFSAAHALVHLPEEHKCHRLHGHNYKVTLTLQAHTLDSNGFVTDYGELDEVKRWIDGTLDHRNLNEVFGDSRATTAEMIAARIFHEFEHRWLHLLSVSVAETENTLATYTKEG